TTLKGVHGCAVAVVGGDFGGILRPEAAGRGNTLAKVHGGRAPQIGDEHPEGTDDAVLRAVRNRRWPGARGEHGSAVWPRRTWAGHTIGPNEEEVLGFCTVIAA